MDNIQTDYALLTKAEKVYQQILLGVSQRTGKTPQEIEEQGLFDPISQAQLEMLMLKMETQDKKERTRFLLQKSWL